MAGQQIGGGLPLHALAQHCRRVNPRQPCILCRLPSMYQLAMSHTQATPALVALQGDAAGQTVNGSGKSTITARANNHAAAPAIKVIFAQSMHPFA